VTPIAVKLVPHEPAWAGIAREEAGRLGGALGSNLVRIEHIGSTSIPGIRAKSTIDLLPIVQSVEAIEADVVRALGYEWHGEFGLPGRRYCTLTDSTTGQRVFNVHIFGARSPQIARHLAFRDYLRTHREEARAYEAVKERAAAQHPDDSWAYTDAKSDWIKACELRALAWRDARS
jgi:GrpB-like predicted nucleotidyltransferase (UPF0157 family)